MFDAKIPCPTTSRGTIEKCHKGRTSWKHVKVWPLSCKHWTWCWNQLTYQPFNPHFTYCYLSTNHIFRSEKCEECMICPNSIRNSASSWFMFYAICIDFINCIKYINRTLHIFDWMWFISMGWLHNMKSWLWEIVNQDDKTCISY